MGPPTLQTREVKMISDDLYSTAVSIQGYLQHYPEIYHGELRARIERLLEEMNAVKSLLDVPGGPEWIEMGRVTDDDQLTAEGITDVPYPRFLGDAN
jgi:hypothetical protein